jgi:hypothetical protein
MLDVRWGDYRFIQQVDPTTVVTISCPCRMDGVTVGALNGPSIHHGDRCRTNEPNRSRLGIWWSSPSSTASSIQPPGSKAGLRLRACTLPLLSFMPRGALKRGSPPHGWPGKWACTAPPSRLGSAPRESRRGAPPRSRGMRHTRSSSTKIDTAYRRSRPRRRLPHRPGVPHTGDGNVPEITAGPAPQRRAGRLFPYTPTPPF